MIGRHDVKAGSPWDLIAPRPIYSSFSLTFALLTLTAQSTVHHIKMASLWNYLSLPTAVFTSPVAAILTPVTAGALVGYTTTSGGCSETCHRRRYVLILLPSQSATLNPYTKPYASRLFILPAGSSVLSGQCFTAPWATPATAPPWPASLRLPPRSANWHTPRKHSTQSS